MATPISTRDLSALGSLHSVERTAQSAAVLDAIISPEWVSRYFSFNSAWDIQRQERMASMRDGCGDEYFAVFSPIGCIIKGFAHESKMSPWATDKKSVWPGVLDAVPAAFANFLTEPAFSMANTTFCLWRIVADSCWSRGGVEFPEGADPDSSEELLWMLDGDPLTYWDFAQNYYERSVNLSAVSRIYKQMPLTRKLVAALNPEIDWSVLIKDALEIGYPVKIKPSTYE